MIACIGEILRGVLVHPIANSPRIASLQRFLQSNRALRDPVGKVLPLLTCVKFGSPVVTEEKGLEVIDIGVVDIGVFPGAPGVGEFVVVVIDIHEDCDPHLFEIAAAECGVGAVFRLAERREEHAGEDSDNRNYDEEFNQSECQMAACEGFAFRDDHRVFCLLTGLLIRSGFSYLTLRLRFVENARLVVDRILHDLAGRPANLDSDGGLFGAENQCGSVLA